MEERQQERRRAAKERREHFAPDLPGWPTCWVCKTGYAPITQLHHLHPLAESNVIRTNKVWLCPNCHALVHELRRFYPQPKRRMTREGWARLDFLEWWLDEQCDPEVFKRLWRVAIDQTTAEREG